MHPQKTLMAVLNLVFGPAVLGSYVWSAKSWPSESLDKLWGNVPEAVQPWYTAWMFVAATGYLVYSYRLFFVVDAAKVRVAGRYGFGLFNVLLVAILVPSMVWMPLTLVHIDHPSTAKWIAIAAGLWTTGLASLAMIFALAKLEPREPGPLAKASVIGAIAFAGQTFGLDACVWTQMFPH